MFRTLLVLLCLGLVSLETVAADQALALDESLLETATTGVTFAARQVPTRSSQPHSRRGRAGTDHHSGSVMQRTGNLDSPCQTPCDNELSCSSLCALACSSSGGSSGCTFDAVLLPQPQSSEAVLALRSAGMFVGLVSTPLYRPPDRTV